MRIVIFFLIFGGLIAGVLAAIRPVTSLPPRAGEGEVQAIADSIPTRIEAANGIDVVVSNTHLGEAKPGDVLQGSFTLVNRTPTPVRYQLHTGCSCGKVDPPVGEIAGGGRVEIRVSLTLRKYGQDEAANVTVTLEGSHRFPVVRFTGSCPSPVIVDPPELGFGQVVQGRSAKTTCTLRPRDSRVVPVCWQARSDDPRIFVKLESHGQTQTLAASLDPQADVGVLRGGVVLTLSDNTLLTIPVRGEVVRLIEYAPVSLRFRADEAQEKSLFIWRTDGEALGDIRVIRQPSEVAVTSVRVSRHKYRISVSRNASPSNTGLGSLVVELETSGSWHRVEMPLSQQGQGGKL